MADDDQTSGIPMPVQSGPAPSVDDYGRIPDTGAGPQSAPPAGQGYGGGDIQQNAVSYFTGAKAMPQQDFDILKSQILGENADALTPTQQNMRVLEAASQAGPDIATGAVQHLKAQYEPRRMQAARALEAGHTDVGAKDATDAMDYVPDAHEVSFVPHQNGVSAIVQDPEGKVSKANFQAPALAGILKSTQGLWDNLVHHGAGAVFGGMGGAEELINKIPDMGQAFTPNTSSPGGGFEGPPKGFGAQESREEVAPQDQPYRGLNPEDQGGGRGGGFGGNIPGAPTKEQPVKGVEVKEGKTGEAAARADEAEADRQFATHQAQDKSTRLEDLPRGHAGMPETLNVRRSAASPSGRIDTAGTLRDLQQQRSAQNARMDNAGLPAGAQMGERLQGGARRIRDQSELPRGWSMMAAEDPRGGWVAVPPGATPPPEAHPERETNPGITPGQGQQRVNVIHNIAGGGPGPAQQTYTATGERLSAPGGTYEMPSHQINPGLPQRGLPQPNARGAGVDRSQVTATAQAQLEQRQIHDYISSLYRRQQNNEQLSNQEKQDLQDYSESARRVLQRRQGGSAQQTAPQQGASHPTINSAEDYAKLPHGTPYIDGRDGHTKIKGQ